MNQSKRVIILGAGAAGLMAAGSIKNADITVLEKNEKAGKKLYITGKGRCNVTNDCDREKLLTNIVTNPKFLQSAFSSFGPQDTMRFFEERGVPLKTERGLRVFPVSDKASDITNALVKNAAQNGAKILYGKEVVNVYKNSNTGLFCVSCLCGSEYIADVLIIATGGKSYPLTGSSGDGCKFAKSLGHSIQPIRPALVPLILGQQVKPLEGLSLINVEVSVRQSKKEYKQFGEMIFTADGVSGPCVLSLSSLLSRDGLYDEAVLKIDLKPALIKEQLDARILRDFGVAKNKQLKNALHELLPKSLISFMIEYAELDGEKSVNSITKAEREKLVQAIKNFVFHIKALGEIEKGIVTGGGVSVSEINPKTMESKIVSSLYVVGEVLDVDALTGGFNIQIALSTGWVAGQSI